MNEVTATKKPRKLKVQSKAAQIRKLFEQGKLTPKQIGAKVGAPMPYVYVVRSKMKAEAGGLPAVAEKKIPVLGGIQEVANEAEARKSIDEIMQKRAEDMALWNNNYQYGSPALVPMQVTMVAQPTFFERVKERIRAWLS
jgi:hypothetical protein